ncbi:MAG: hypothetical protein PHS93_09140, partial [Candidatus Omnitrophica bacterium]|nr:hypothetical protein [Candidatus Omnitrophota bacterium]
MYDLSSEMRTVFSDYATRKRECALKAGWSVEKSTRKFPAEVENILVGGDPTANKIIISYIRIQGDPNLILYYSFSELLAVEMDNSLKEKDPKIIKYIRENVDKLGLAIAKLEESIFGGKEVAGMRRALYATMVTDSFIPRPETIARAIQDRKLDLGDDPFYKVK